MHLLSWQHDGMLVSRVSGLNLTGMSHSRIRVQRLRETRSLQAIGARCQHSIRAATHRGGIIAQQTGQCSLLLVAAEQLPASSQLGHDRMRALPLRCFLQKVKIDL